MPMYNLIEYSKIYLKRSGTLWNSESFEYKTIITEKTAINVNTIEVGFSVPLKHLSNFWAK